jgi:RNA polymerase sigma-70 factor, ECF subfamily
MAVFPEIQFPGSDEVGSSPIRDETLMRRISQQQQQALKELYSRYAGLLRTLIGGVVREESEADDVLQESFLQIWHEARRYSPKAGKPLGWAITIAHRRAIDRVRRRESYRCAKRRFEDELKPAAQSPLGRAIHADITTTDLRQFLGKQMQTLPRVQHEAIELAYFCGMSQREIAANTRTSLGTVRTRLQLGLQKLTRRVRPLRHKI